MRRKLFIVIILFGSFIASRGDVPSPFLKKCAIPYFLEPMEFRSLKMQMLPPEAYGMVPDLYSDFQWNPAFLRNVSQRSVYLDFNPGQTSSVPWTPWFTTSSDYAVIPQWYSRTSVSNVYVNPLYNLALLLPIGSRWTLGLLNRTLFDYGPFRTGYSGYWNEMASDAARDQGIPLVPSRLEVDKNQQTVIGNQSDMVLARSMTSQLDLGLRVGYFVYDHEGDLYNSKWANYPHSAFATLNDEALSISGNHVELGMGFVFHPNAKIKIGGYGGMLFGNGSDQSSSRDTSYTWSEQDVAPQYYQWNRYFLSSEQSSSIEGKRPRLTLTFERALTDRWSIRSFLYGTWADLDYSGNFLAEDTSSSDRQYDEYEWPSGTHFRRHESHGSRSQIFHGDGKEESNFWRYFISLIYTQGKQWSFLGGIDFQRAWFSQKVEESSGYKSHQWDRYSLYKPETDVQSTRSELEYTFKMSRTQWRLSLPIGIQMQVVRGFSVVLGTRTVFSLLDETDRGERLYPIRLSQKWQDEKQIVDDLEINRYEAFKSNPAKTWNRSWAQYFGIVYSHSSGIQVYVKCADEISKPADWALGFEIQW